jgi:hypothetical protein
MPEFRTREDLKRSVEPAAQHPTVLAPATFDRVDGQPVAELLLVPRLDRVPPAICRLLSREDCGIRRVKPQGDPGHLVVEVQ